MSCRQMNIGKAGNPGFPLLSGGLSGEQANCRKALFPRPAHSIGEIKRFLPGIRLLEKTEMKPERMKTAEEPDSGFIHLQ